MTPHEKRLRVGLVFAVVVVLAMAFAITKAASRHHTTPPAAPTVTVARVPSGFDRDKASDCWAHPDRHGRRHCSMLKGGR